MMHRRRFLSLASGLAGGAILPASGHAWASTAARAPERIVSVGGAVTETLFALGLGNRVAAVDTTSTYPAEAAALPKVGYLRQLSAEGVLAMRPDLVLLGSGAGPAAAVKQLAASSVPVRHINVTSSAEGVLTLIRETGAATQTRTAADALADQAASQFRTLRTAIAGHAEPSVLLLLNTGNGPMLGAGADTAAEAIIRLAGGRLALPGLVGYRPLSLEPILAADPDWLIIPSHVADMLGGPSGLAGLDVVASTRAGRSGRVVIADSLYSLGFGPRTPQAAADLAALLHPDADIPTLGRSAGSSGLMETLIAI